MKVLHVYRTYFPDPPGGLQEAIRQIALASNAFDTDARVFALSPNPIPSKLSHDGISVMRAKSLVAPASCDIGGFDAFRQFSAECKWADLLHFHFPWPFADLLSLAVSNRKPRVMTYHSDVVRQRLLGAAYRPLMRKTLRAMDRVVATSPRYIETSPVLSRYVDPARLTSIPLGIDEATYPKVRNTGLPARLGLAKNEPYVLFIGVLRYYKGLHFLVEAARNVRGKIVIAGSGPEGAALQAQASQLGLGNVVFTGQVTDAEKVALLQNCRALVLPSHLRSEAYGMVLVEASMFGKPMVSCEIGTGTSFVNSHLETGFVVPPESPLALAQAINTLLENTPLAAQYGAAARARYEKLFSGPALGSAYAKLYEQVHGAKV